MIFTILCTSSSHLAVLQVVAWTGMFVENVRGGDLEQAISMTFDGEHPCALCNVIAEAATDGASDDTEKAPLPTVQVLDLKVQPLERVVLIPPAPMRLGIEKSDQWCSTRKWLPAVPPPKVA